MPVNGPREKLAADLELLKPVADHVAYWSCGLIAGQSLTIGDLRALLAEPKPTPIPDIAIPISDALRQVEAALRDLVTANSDCTCAPFWGPYGKTDPTCAYHELQTEVDAARAALALLPALAQQMEEGDRRIATLEGCLREMGRAVKRSDAEARVAPSEAQQAELTRTREALTVAEGALRNLHAMVWGECPSLLNEDSGGSAHLDQQIKDALARIAALSPTGTPGAKKGSPE